MLPHLGKAPGRRIHGAKGKGLPVLSDRPSIAGITAFISVLFLSERSVASCVDRPPRLVQSTRAGQPCRIALGPLGGNVEDPRITMRLLQPLSRKPHRPLRRGVLSLLVTSSARPAQRRCASWPEIQVGEGDASKTPEATAPVVHRRLGHRLHADWRAPMEHTRQRDP